jgi:RNA polymerase sigma factor (sigma-70 family)
VPLAAENPDQTVIEALSKAHGSALIRYFLRRGIDSSDAEDAAQEVFVRLARRGGMAGIEHADSYLFQTAASVAADLFRKKKHSRNFGHIAYNEELHAPSDHSPLEFLEGREQLRLVLLGLQELPERSRTIFILARLEHMKQYEIARRLGISVGAVEQHLVKAGTYLMQRVGRVR